MSTRDQAPRERRDEELDRDDPPRQADASERLLRALQRSAGNQALSARLARAPDAGKPDVKQGEEEKSESPGRATLPDIGTIPLLSARFGDARGSVDQGGTGSGRRDSDASSVKEMAFASKLGEHSPRLSQAVVAGKAMDAEIVFSQSKPPLRLKLTGAIVSSYTVSGPGENSVEAWSLELPVAASVRP